MSNLKKAEQLNNYTKKIDVDKLKYQIFIYDLQLVIKVLFQILLLILSVGLGYLRLSHHVNAISEYRNDPLNDVLLSKIVMAYKNYRVNRRNYYKYHKNLISGIAERLGLKDVKLSSQEEGKSLLWRQINFTMEFKSPKDTDVYQLIHQLKNFIPFVKIESLTIASDLSVGIEFVIFTPTYFPENSEYIPIDYREPLPLSLSHTLGFDMKDSFPHLDFLFTTYHNKNKVIASISGHKLEIITEGGDWEYSSEEDFFPYKIKSIFNNGIVIEDVDNKIWLLPKVGKAISTPPM